MKASKDLRMFISEARRLGPNFSKSERAIGSETGNLRNPAKVGQKRRTWFLSKI